MRTVPGLVPVGIRTQQTQRYPLPIRNTAPLTSPCQTASARGYLHTVDTTWLAHAHMHVLVNQPLPVRSRTGMY
jgi:hypothetical protein